jgi:hypothetical protein
VSPAAVRARALRGGWRRMPGNDGKARVLLTQDVVRAAAERPREQPRKAPITELVGAIFRLSEGYRPQLPPPQHPQRLMPHDASGGRV